MRDRTAFTPLDIVKEIWAHLDLPPSALSALSLPDADGTSERDRRAAVPSSFKIGHLAQSTIALSALGAAVAHSVLEHSTTTTTTASTTTSTTSTSPENGIPRIAVPLRHAVLEFQCERLYTLAGRPPAETWGPIGGLHPTADGHVRIHDAFPHHRRGALALLGLPTTCTDRGAVSERTRGWKSVELETAAVEEKGVAIYALRSYAEWDASPQARALPDLPVNIHRVEATPASPQLISPFPSPPRQAGGGVSSSADESPRLLLSGLRVLELSRVIAAPVAGKTLAAHGADVLWVTSPRLPDLPGLDREFARGKHSVHLDLDDGADRATLLDLARSADVVIRGYRPGGLAARGLDAGELAAANPGIVVADMSAFGPSAGRWAGRRGFDSLVQTCSGMNVSEAEHYRRAASDEEHEVARPLPCQALDHGAGFLLATGICAALYRREKDRREGRLAGAYVVDVSLAGVMKYLRSLGQYQGRTGFEGDDLTVLATGEKEEEEEEQRALFETRQTAFGKMTFLRHSASVDGFQPNWDLMPAPPLGPEQAAWRGL